MLIAIIILSVLLIGLICSNVYLYFQVFNLKTNMAMFETHVDEHIIPDLQVSINYMNKKLNDYGKYPDQLARRMTQCEIETQRVMNGLKILNQGFEVPTQSHMAY